MYPASLLEAFGSFPTPDAQRYWFISASLSKWFHQTTPGPLMRACQSLRGSTGTQAVVTEGPPGTLTWGGGQGGAARIILGITSPDALAPTRKSLRFMTLL